MAAYSKKEYAAIVVYISDAFYSNPFTHLKNLYGI